MRRNRTLFAKGVLALAVGALVGTGFAVWQWPRSAAEDLPELSYVVRGGKTFAHVPLEEPAILITWFPGWKRYEKDTEPSFAVWRDGTAIWREPFAAWTSRDTVNWSLNDGSYHLGCVKPSAVTKALEELDQAGVFKMGTWSDVPLDASGTRIIVRFDNRTTDISSSMYEPSSGFSLEANEAWEQVLRAARELIPEEGIRIEEPELVPAQEVVGIGTIDPAHAEEVQYLLSEAGISSQIEGSVVYGVSVSGHHAKAAVRILYAPRVAKKIGFVPTD